MSLFVMITLLICAVAAYTDLRTGYIPNWLTLSGIGVGVLGHLLFVCRVAGWQEGLFSAALSLTGLLLCSVAPAVMFWKGAIGGGDLKLFAAIGALCHPMIGIEVQAYAFAVAAVVVPARLTREGRLWSVLKGSCDLILNPLRSPSKKRQLPSEAYSWTRLGPAILAGALITVLGHGLSGFSLGAP